MSDLNVCARCGKPKAEHPMVNYIGQDEGGTFVGPSVLICPKATYLDLDSEPNMAHTLRTILEKQ